MPTVNRPGNGDERPTRQRWQLTFAVGALLGVLGAGWWLWLAVFADSSTSSATATRVESTSATPAAVIPTPVPTPADIAAPTPAPTPVDTASTPSPTAAVDTTATPADTAPTPVDPAPSSVDSAPSPAPLVNQAEPLLIDTDLGTGSTEFSAITRNGDTNRLMIAGDEGQLFEFNLGSGGEPLLPVRRTIVVRVGAGDIEGVAWMSDTTYVLAHENDGRLTVVDINDSATVIDADQLIRTIDTGIREDNGSGLEGVAYVRGDPAIEFAVVDEKPATVYLITRDGEVTAVAMDLGVPDLSDVWVDGRNFYLLSDEGKVVVVVEIADSGQTVTEIGRAPLGFENGQFGQPEGVVGDGRGGLYIVGENPGPGRYSFGLLPPE